MTSHSTRTTALIATTALALGTLAGCTAPTPSFDPLVRVEPALVELLQASPGVSAVLIGRDRLTAVAVSEDRLAFWRLEDRAILGRETVMNYPVVPSDAVDAHAIAATVKELAGICGDREFNIDVEFLSRDFVLSEVRCSAEVPKPERADAIRVNGHPLEPMAGTWRADEWARVRQLVSAVAPASRVVGVRISRGEIIVEPGTAFPGSCRVLPFVALDGTTVGWMCWPATQQSTGDWSQLADEDLVRAVDEAASEAGIVVGPQTQIDVDATATGWEVTVRVGTSSASRNLP